MATFNRIVELLKEQNKTQKQLMEYLGLGKTAFTGWKSGTTTSYKKYIGQIADFFDVSIDYLMCNTDIKAKQNPSLTDEQRELIEAYEAASPELQAAVKAFLRARDGK